jgi:hypothetical protein
LFFLLGWLAPLPGPHHWEALILPRIPSLEEVVVGVPKKIGLFE